MWRTGGLRVSMNQLALPKSRGGLNLLIPKLKLPSLITNRYLKEQHCMPFTSRIKPKTENPPDIQSIPKNYPCLETLTIECAYITERMIENKGTAREIYKTIINFIPPPSITKNTHPDLKWNKIWRNINSNELCSNQRTLYFLLVNEKK